MKKAIFIISLIFSFCDFANAKEQLSYLEEAKFLGSVAGQGLACRAKKYQDYELLARAIVLSKARSDKESDSGLMEYSRAKASAFINTMADNRVGCDEFVYSFNRQKIFKSMLYSDGKIKLYDGTLITPHKTYDASQIYKRDPEVYEKAEKQYQKYVDTIKKQKNTAKKVPLRDSNYSNYSNQF